MELSSKKNFTSQELLNLSSLQIELDTLYEEKARGAFTRSRQTWCQGWGEWKRAKTQSLEKNRLLLTKTNKQTNKNHPVGEKLNWLVSRQGRTRQGRTRQGRTRQGRAGQAGQGWTGHRRHQTLGNEPTRNCKHKEIIKGANDEGNEGKQLGKINQ